jgi:hypothetical protein
VAGAAQRDDPDERMRAPSLADVYAVYAALALAIGGPALHGPFVSDDLPNVAQNPYIQTLSAANLREILHPFGEVSRNTFNWAPVHSLAHALEWRAFGGETTGFHVVNALIHAAAATALFALLAARGLPAPAAALAALVFVAHPANVEAFAWIFQLKTVLSSVLALAALLLHPRRPALAAVCFALALLTKATAAFALVMAVVWTVTDPAWRLRWPWLLAWLAALLPYAVIESLVNSRFSSLDAPLHGDPLVAARTIVAIGARYLAMAYTGHGISAFHDPPRALAWSDPWWLAGLALGVAFAARIAFALRARREEAAWWLSAAAGWAPISQVIPFPVPMADRYLYDVLPGLIGGTCFAARDAWRSGRLHAAAARLPTVITPARCAAVAALAIVAAFGARGHAQARVWRSSVALSMDSARNYPHGQAAHLMRAAAAAQRGDAAAAAQELRLLMEHGYDRFIDLETQPMWDAVRADPAFRAVVFEMAGVWIARSAGAEPTQADLRMRGLAHGVREEYAEAIASLEQALAAGGPLAPHVRAELLQMRAAQERARRAGGG